MMKRTLLVMFLMLMGLPMVSAQDTPAPTDLCTLETVQAVADTMAELIAQAQADATAGDLTAAAATLAALDNAAGDLRIQCGGLSFSGDTDTVIGPVSVPTGTYIIRTTGEGEGSLAISIQTLAGKCGTGVGGYSPAIAGLFGADAIAQGEEGIFVSEDCRMLLDVNVSAAWALTFEQVQ